MCAEYKNMKNYQKLTCWDDFILLSIYFIISNILTTEITQFLYKIVLFLYRNIHIVNSKFREKTCEISFYLISDGTKLIF